MDRLTVWHLLAVAVMLASFGHRTAVSVLGVILTVASLLLTLSRPIRSIPLLSEVQAASAV